MYVIRFGDGNYYERRAGFDWGRSSSPSMASHFDDEYDAIEEAANMLPLGTPYQIVTDNDCGELP